MVRVVAAVVIAAAITWAAVRLILGHYPDEGPYAPVTATHGIHVGDVVILVVWAASLWMLWLWIRRGRRNKVP